MVCFCEYGDETALDAFSDIVIAVDSAEAKSSYGYLSAVDWPNYYVSAASLGSHVVFNVTGFFGPCYVILALIAKQAGFCWHDMLVPLVESHVGMN